MGHVDDLRGVLRLELLPQPGDVQAAGAAFLSLLRAERGEVAVGHEALGYVQTAVHAGNLDIADDDLFRADGLAVVVMCADYTASYLHAIIQKIAAAVNRETI